MNLNFTDCIACSANFQKTTFKMNYQNNDDIVSKIKLAIKFIAENPNYNLDLGTLSKISGFSTQEVYDCLFDSANYELFEFWQNALKEKTHITNDANKPANEQTEFATSVRSALYRQDILWTKADNSVPVKKQTCNAEIRRKEIISAEFEKIERAIKQILSDPSLEATTANLSELTGISGVNILNRLHSTRSDYLYNLWQYVQAVKECDNPSRRQKLAKFYGIQDESIANVKTKKYKVALKMIKHAVSTKSKISYREIEKCSGLNKSEIDKLVSDYAKYIQNRTHLAMHNKEIQSKWPMEKESVS